MIKGISSAAGILVSGGATSMPYINMSSMSAGMVRYNGNTQNFEVYDGSNWMTMPSSYANIEFDSDVRSIIEWARKKRNEEIDRDRLAQTNSAIKDLIKQIEEKEEQIKVIQTLLQGSDERKLQPSP